MTENRRHRVKQVLQAALDREASGRAAFVRDACGEDATLQGEVESLLAAHEQSGSLVARPAIQAFDESAAAATSGLRPGDRFGPYQITGRLGVGGMGEVYRAHHEKLARDVAIKILPRAFTTDPARLARFEREARLLASLNHPNVGAIYGFEDVNGVGGLVLELVDGETLSERLRRGPLPVTEAVTLAHQIAEALEAAHEKGIIHRDLKPANIKVRRDGTLKVLDFGLGKALEGPAPPCGSLAITDAERGRRHTPGRHFGDARVHEPGTGPGQASRQAHGQLGVRVRPV